MKITKPVTEDERDFIAALAALARSIVEKRAEVYETMKQKDEARNG